MISLASPGRSEAQSCLRLVGTAISARGVGAIQIGMPRDSVRRLCPAAKDTNRTNDDYEEMENGLLLLSGRDSVWAVIDSTGHVESIDILTSGPGRPGGL